MAESPAPARMPPKPFVSGGASRPPVAIVGAGAVGTALAQRLRAGGYPIEAVLSRSARSAQQLARAVEAPTASTALHALPQRATLLFLCVPDAQVHAVAEALADQPHPWKRCLVAHTSGVLPASVLRLLAAQGAATLSFHPLQAFAQGAGAEVFDGIYVGLEGKPDAIAAGQVVAEALDVKTLVLPAESKARYHLAASMASNFLVTLLALAGEVLDEATVAVSQSIGEQEGADWLLPLVEGTMRNLKEATPEAALTGPVARGDEETIAAHLKALHRHHPGLVSVYAALATETTRLAARTKGLPAATIDRLLLQLSNALDVQADAES